MKANICLARSPRPHRTLRASRNLLVLATAVLLLTAPGAEGASDRAGTGPREPRAAGPWALVSGTDPWASFGSYGTKGVPAPANVPGARYGAATWTDAAGGFWLFGGFGNTAASRGYPNDLWKWDGTAWTWVNGTTLSDNLGSYGQQGVTSSSNVPPGREGAATWTDRNGAFWLFGGMRKAGNLKTYLSDLWRWDGTNWTWVGGRSSPNQRSIFGTKGQPFPTNLPGARAGAVSWVDKIGTVWLFGGTFTETGSSAPDGPMNDLWRWDGTNWTWIHGSRDPKQPGVYGVKGVADGANVPGAREGASVWVDKLGHSWIFGGTGYGDSGSGLLGDVWKWDGAAWTWMAGGSRPDLRGNYGVIGIPSASNAPGARTGAASWVDTLGIVWVYGGKGFGTRDSGYLGDLWRWSGSGWTWMGGSKIPDIQASFGEQGTSSPENGPGGRARAATWADRDGHIWLFSGAGLAANDLWKREGTSWTWVGGSSGLGQAGSHGEQGVTSAANVLGAREGAASWSEGEKSWVFGGGGNDLWKWDGQNWIWLGGVGDTGQPGVYGTKGVAGPTNRPGARSYASAGASQGRGILFGGSGQAATTSGYLNDLWEWDGSSWTWRSGSNEPNRYGLFGTKGEPSAEGVPGARSGAAAWTDEGGRLWIFGGTGYGEADGPGYLSDLWRWDGMAWTWISGPKGVDQGGSYGTKGVPSPANVPPAREGAATWTDANGNFWLFGGFGGAGRRNDLWRWDGSAWTWVSGSSDLNGEGSYGSQGVPASTNVPAAREGAAAWFEADGNAWIFGGARLTGVYGDVIVLNDLWRWDGTDWTWMGGYGPAGWSDDPASTLTPFPRRGAVAWNGPGRTLYLLGGSGNLGDFGGTFNDLWAYTPPDALKLSLLGDRFEVTADYVTYSGSTGQGRALALTQDTGTFWFFSASSVEVVVKMVGFCAGGATNVAIYAGGLTDLDVTLHVTDKATGLTKDYRNPLGHPFNLIRDGPFLCLAPSAPRPDGTSLEVAELARPPAPRSWTPAGPAPTASGCAPDGTTLCLLNGRFQVRAAYQDYGGGVGNGKAVALTPDTGTFWFFDAKNVEVVVKMVSFCSGGATNVAVYGGGLTDLMVTVTVTDMATGLSRSYTNPLGTPFQLIRDGPFRCP